MPMMDGQKELRETYVWLQVIIRSKLIKPVEKLNPLLNENDQLIAILFRSIETARQNEKTEKK